MNNFKVVSENETKTSATVVVEPLEKGYGHTLGNALRRTMLSSLSGAAITAVKIEGVSHQFSTIPGVKEDVIEILLNLKNVRVKVYANSDEDKSFKMSLKANGVGQVLASSIDTLGKGEIVNPEAVVATITDAKVKLNIELTVETGVGYAAVEGKSAEIGVMALDGLFSPVLSVNYTVETTRVGRRADLDKLNLEIITDGTIKPVDAVVDASRILAAAFKQIVEPSVEEVVVETSASNAVSSEVLKASVEELDLPVRITNALKAIDIDTIETLIATPRIQLVKAKNLGAKSIGLISEKLAERGLSLSEA
jgi:DNA-directed RNA polymerase subunit alpha